ncbi:MAG TPA: hypothetical protein EYP04_03625 [Anaerolineae bacterium]|nr:hypothetical protein [Anaerolineae bacterium]
MHNPYVVGGYVCGSHHYGRQSTIDHILKSPNDAVWVVGTRRMGKTSLLRQLEFLTLNNDTFVPLFWDMQGCESMSDLGAELFYALEDQAERFEALGVNLMHLEGRDVPSMLRELRTHLRVQGRVLLLLLDETEVLIHIAVREPLALARLRKALQGGHGLRTVLTSTKALARLNDICRDWATSPFLFGFAPLTLVGLSSPTAEALIRQTQEPQMVSVPDHLVDEIREHTNNHPYLLQFLCHHLFVDEGKTGRLRDITPNDLMVDDVLAGFCATDFRHLSSAERAILLWVSEKELGSPSELKAAMRGVVEPMALQTFLYGLVKLGYLRSVYGRLAVGNTFMSAWLAQNRERLRDQLDSEVSDNSVQELLDEGRRQEIAHLRERLEILQANKQELLRQKAQYGLRVPLDLINEIHQTEAEIKQLAQELDQLAGT